jgi:hypothetical protein
MRPDVPELPGVLSRAGVAATAAAIAAQQEPDGAIPWAAGQHTDVWNHVEAAMALVVGGLFDEAAAAYEWCLATQRRDGSWPMRLKAGRVDDAGSETNMCAYLAVGVWHHWLVCRDEGLVRRTWPAVRAGLDLVVGLQQPFGGIAWAQAPDGSVDEGALLSGSASIHQALRAGLAIAALMEEAQPDWELAVGRLGHALREHRDLFLDKSAFSMDWYYPVLGGAVRGEPGRALLASRWDDFVVPGLGVRCVATNPWVTGAETCELALALDAVGDRAAALTLLRDMQHLRADDGSYWTGYVYPDETVWPQDRTNYTAAAVVLAADALAGATPGSDIFRGTTLPDGLPSRGPGCGCATTVGHRVS